jgi:hypothetical protein
MAYAEDPDEDLSSGLRLGDLDLGLGTVGSKTSGIFSMGLARRSTQGTHPRGGGAGTASGDDTASSWAVGGDVHGDEYGVAGDVAAMDGTAADDPMAGIEDLERLADMGHLAGANLADELRQRMKQATLKEVRFSGHV